MGNDNSSSNLPKEGTINFESQKKKISSQQSSVYMSKKAIGLYGIQHGAARDTWRKRAEMRVPKEHRVNKIRQVFKFKKKLGSGATGSVSKVINRQTQERSALKELKNKYFAEHQASIFLRELVILESLKHENILQLKGVWKDKHAFYIETAYYNGGELFDKISKASKFNEREALGYLIPILSAVQYLHNSGFVHRDLKPSNIVFDSQNVLKIIDFGTSEIIIDDEIYEYNKDIPIGTALFCSPEWELDRSGAALKKSDTWAIGVITYIMMVGCFPFRDTLDILEYKNVLSLPPGFLKKKVLSSKCLDFLHMLLECDYDKRFSADQCLNHEWVKDVSNSQKAEEYEKDLATLGDIRSINNQTKIHRLLTKREMKDYDEVDRNLLLSNIKNEEDVVRYLNSPSVDRLRMVDIKRISNKKFDSLASVEEKKQYEERIKSIEPMNSAEIDAEFAALNASDFASNFLAQLKEFEKGVQGDEVELSRSIEDEEDDEEVKLVEDSFSGLNVNSSASAFGRVRNKSQFEVSDEFVIDDAVVSQLMEMGLGNKDECVSAILRTKSNDPNVATEWLLSQKSKHSGIDKSISDIV